MACYPKTSAAHLQDEHPLDDGPGLPSDPDTFRNSEHGVCSFLANVASIPFQRPTQVLACPEQDALACNSSGVSDVSEGVACGL